MGGLNRTLTLQIVLRADLTNRTEQNQKQQQRACDTLRVCKLNGKRSAQKQKIIIGKKQAKQW